MSINTQIDNWLAQVSISTIDEAYQLYSSISKQSDIGRFSCEDCEENGFHIYAKGVRSLNISHRNVRKILNQLREKFDIDKFIDSEVDWEDEKPAIMDSMYPEGYDCDIDGDSYEW